MAAAKKSSKSSSRTTKRKKQPASSKTKNDTANFYTSCPVCYQPLTLTTVRGAATQQSGKAKKATDTAGVAEEELCVVCCDKRRDALLLDCGHMFTCNDCFNTMQKGTPKAKWTCPICRQKVRVSEATAGLHCLSVCRFQCPTSDAYGRAWFLWVVYWLPMNLCYHSFGIVGPQSCGCGCWWHASARTLIGWGWIFSKRGVGSRNNITKNKSARIRIKHQNRGPCLRAQAHSRLSGRCNQKEHCELFTTVSECGTLVQVHATLHFTPADFCRCSHNTTA